MKQMKIIKRSGEEKEFDIVKIENAIRKASQAVDYKCALSEGRIKLIAEEVAGVCEARDRAMTVEEIQHKRKSIFAHLCSTAPSCRATFPAASSSQR